MVDENLIAALESSLQQTRNAQSRLTNKLQEIQREVLEVREQIAAHEEAATKTEQAIFALLVSSGSADGSHRPTRLSIDDEYQIGNVSGRADRDRDNIEPKGSVVYMNQHRRPPLRQVDFEPVSERFSDRTITQACTLLLREAGRAMHVNELYNALIAGGMKFKGNNPTISVAVTLSRNTRFKKVGPGRFELAMRDEAERMVS